MSDKRAQLIEAAWHLFGGQGFGKTTIQDIADQAGISKGAVYLHFRSKSEILAAIMERMDEEVKAGVRAILDRDDLSPKEKLHKQLCYQFQDVMEHQRLMKAYLEEADVALDEQMMLQAQKMRYDWQEIQEDCLRMVYADQAPNHITDLAVTLSGVLNEYYVYMLLEGLELESEKIVDYLVFVVDAVAANLKDSKQSPILTHEMLPGREKIEAQMEAVIKRRIEETITAMREEAEKMEEADAGEVNACLTALETELAREEPNRYVLQGLLANLRDYKPLQQHRRTLATELRLKLV
jgi:AcrR family transcriptional regulator